MTDALQAALRMLVLDDEAPIRFSMKEYFEALGYEVDCAHEAGQAQALLGDGAYAVVIADLRLGGSRATEGLSVLEYARRHCPATRTVLLTAYGSADVEREAQRVGVDRLLHKPRPLAELAQVVRGLLRNAPFLGQASMEVT